MLDNPIHLTILRRGDTHIVDLAEVQAIIPRSETRVDGAFLEEISQEIKRITNVVGPEFRRAATSVEPEARRNPHIVRELKSLGSLIFSHLLPQAAREKLRGSESCNLYLRLDDHLVHIPWELAFDGQQFLGMKFRVGRQIITHHKVAQATPVRAVSDALRVLIVSDPSETLKNVSRESEQLCEILDAIPGLQVRLLGGRGVKRIPLLAALRDSDIVHFAGHSQFDEKNPENSGWLLYDGLLSASEISKLDQTPLLVFSNSCQAGATKNWQGDYLFEGQAFGLGSAFLLAGVRNYVGTFCVVHDEESRFLAVEFYRHIARGETIGEALLEARVATAEEMGLDRLTWASYMLYGDPEFSLTGVIAGTTPSSFTPPRAKIEIDSKRLEISETRSAIGKRDRSRPVVNERFLGWVFGGLIGVVLAALFLFMWWKQPTGTRVEPTPGPSPPVGRTTPSSSAKPRQDLKDIKVEVDRLQATTREEVIVFLRLFNKTAQDLTVVLGDSEAFVTDDKGSSYQHRDSSGIAKGPRYKGNWTYIPANGEHTVSMRFSQRGSRPTKDSIFSISAEVLVAGRDDLERAHQGLLPQGIDGVRTVNISIHGIRPD